VTAPLSRKLRAAGVELHTLIEGEGPPLLVLHGFTGSSESMQDLAAGLRDSHRVVRLDLVGHGRSAAPRDPAAYTLERCVEQVAAVLDALSTGPVHLVGYSMGGRLALALCAWRPERVRSALLVGASAGIADPAARAARRRDDEALAARIEREGLERFVDHWMALPLFAGQLRLGAAAWERARAQRLGNRAHGLAHSLRQMGSGAQPPLHDLLPGVAARVCLVAGAEDAKFVAVAHDLAQRLPRADVRLVPGAGHACHLEQPEAFLGVARRFLGEVESAARADRASAPPTSNPQTGVTA
jgi:2-succinyl-6-hydroxy-2,4-cyclohexadiene-1-carboxylate synthase